MQVIGDRPSKFQLMSIMFDEIKEVSIKGVEGILLGVEKEDGSGSSFNLKFLSHGKYIHVYVRTID